MTNFSKEISSIAVYEHTSVSEIYTIAIPTYKRAGLLRETIQSIFNQTEIEYQFNILVVDNNPDRNDETEILMERYKSNPVVSYYKNSQNLGMAGNWNRLFLLAKTKYVIMLHDDDLLHPMFMHYIDNSIKSINSKFTMIKPQENRWNDCGTPHQFEQICGPAKTRRIFDIENYSGFPIGAPTGCLIVKNDFIALGGFNVEYSQTAADVDFVVRCGLEYPIYQIEKKLVIYRILTNASFSVETQYLGVSRCFNITKRLLKSYHIPNFIFNPFWCVYVKSWSENIKREFCPDFDYKTAIKRCGLKKYSNFEGYSSWIFIKFVETAYLAFHGKFRLMSLKFWIYKYLK